MNFIDDFKKLWAQVKAGDLCYRSLAIAIWFCFGRWFWMIYVHPFSLHAISGLPVLFFTVLVCTSASYALHATFYKIQNQEWGLIATNAILVATYTLFFIQVIYTLYNPNLFSILEVFGDYWFLQYFWWMSKKVRRGEHHVKIR